MPPTDPRLPSPRWRRFGLGLFLALLGACARAGDPPLTPQEFARYEQTKRSSTVRAIRTFLNGYHSRRRAKAMGECVACDELKALPDELTRGPFIVAVVDRNLFGGEWVTIIFQARPHLLLSVWVHHGDVVAVTRGLMPPGEQRDLIERAANWLADPHYGV